MQQSRRAVHYLGLAGDEDLQESLLDRILSVRATAQDPACEPQRRRAVVGHEAVPIEHEWLSV